MPLNNKNIEKKNSTTRKNDDFSRMYRNILPDRHNILYFVLSFGIALFLWYGMIGREQIEAQYTVRLDYRNIPDNLIIREGLAQEATVHLRGASHLFQMLSKKTFTHTVDLADLKKGANMVELEIGELADLRSLDILSIRPAHLLIVSEDLIRKEVVLEPLVINEDDTFLLINVELNPKKVLLEGAASIVEPMTRILVPLKPSAQIQEGKYTESVALITPQQVEAFPPLVEISYEMLSMKANIINKLED